jgi:hypothetical protein
MPGRPARSACRMSLHGGTKKTACRNASKVWQLMRMIVISEE